jgi:hypothetical protein
LDVTGADGQHPYFNSRFHDTDTSCGIPILTPLGEAIGGTFVAIGNGFVGTLHFISGEHPAKDAVRMMEDGSSADNRRQGINKLLEFDYTKRDPYTTRYRQIGALDADPTVRAAAIRACNRARDPHATALFIKSLDDKSDWVRLEAAKGLVNIPDVAAVPALLRTLSNRDENRDVRIAAADALKHYRTLTVARALVAVLSDRDFAVSWQARKSLKYLFNRDLGYSDGKWLGFLTGPQAPVK